MAIFLSKGYVARAAYSGEEALVLVAEWCPDLLILDVFLPGMNGIDLALVLVAQYPNCSFLLLSGASATSELIASARLAGHAFDVLAKPIPPEDLLRLAASFFPHAWVQ